MRNIGASDAGGGAYHAIIGTLEQVLLASLISVPIGLLTAIYLVEYGQGSRLSRAISFFVDVMTGIPSVVSGLFILAFWILVLGHAVLRFRRRAGAVDPDDADGGPLRRGDAPAGPERPARGLLRAGRAEVADDHQGRPADLLRRHRTGVMLAVARVAGETAPLLLTVFFTDSINTDPFNGPQMGSAALRLRSGDPSARTPPSTARGPERSRSF